MRDRSHMAERAIRRFVVEAIASRRLEPGDKLPTERDLALRFSTGRNTVRRTLLALEAEGRIDRHVGRGTFVAAAGGPRGTPPRMPTVGLGASPGPDPAGSGLSQIARVASPLDLMELRLSLEPSIAALCVHRAGTADIERMWAIVAASRAAGDLRAFEDEDDALHRCMALATRNPLFVAVADLVTAVRGEARWGDLKQKTLSDALRLRHTAEHVAIVEAIARRDEAAARAAMEAHLRSVKAMMFGP